MARGRRRHHRGRRKPGNWFTRLSIGKRIAVCMGGLILALGITGVAYAASKLNKLDTEEIPAEDIVVNKQAEEAGRGVHQCSPFWYRLPERGAGDRHPQRLYHRRQPEQ